MKDSDHPIYLIICGARGEGININEITFIEDWKQ